MQGGLPQLDSLGVYVSIPFCRSKCTYCNFASGVYPAADHARYIHRLLEDLSQAAACADREGVELPRTVDTVYLGGGTPSLLAPDLIEKLFAGLRAAFAFEPDAEVTVECAPGQIADETLAAFAAVGVNRVSLGVQSFVDTEAHASGRLHSRAIIESDLRRLRAMGITNLSVDLIAGLAGQTFVSWNESLAALTGSGVPHASLYMLEVDEDSRLGREMLAGGTRYRAGLVPHDDAIAEMYRLGVEALAGAGLAQYEISNFARPGFESRHNLRYWQRRPYLGLGLDASSMLREVRSSHATNSVLRSTNTSDLRAYLDGAAEPEMDWLDLDRQHEEAWFLGLRMNRGVELASVEHEFGPSRLADAREVIERLERDGLVACDGTTVHLTDEGRMLSNDVFQEFLDLVACEPA